MLGIVTGVIVLAVADGGAFAQLSQEPQAIATRYGSLSVRKDRVLLFRGRPVQPKVQGNTSLDLATPYRIGLADVVLITDRGGTACPFLYYFATVTSAGAKATPAFGTCAGLTQVKRASSTLSVHMPGYRGPFEPEQQRLKAARERHVFVFRAGVVTEDGKPIR
jgi:hypothetical protein